MARNFYIPSAALKYFKRLNAHSKSGKIGRNMEFWWLCAQVGLLKNDSSRKVEDANDMVAHLDLLNPSQSRIRGVLLMEYINAVKIGSSPPPRDLVEEVMQSLFTDETASSLTEEGQKTLDKYAASGFELIEEEIGAQDELKNFIRLYHQLVQDLVEERPVSSFSGS